MTERMSAARLAEIESMNAQDMSTIQPGYHPGVIRDLLAELREVTRERDEARGVFWLKQDEYVAQVGTWKIIQRLEEERDEARAELARMERNAAIDEKHHADHHGEEERLSGLINATLSGLETPVSRAVKQHLGYRDLVDERDALRAEVKRLRSLLATPGDAYVMQTQQVQELQAENAKLKAVAKEREYELQCHCHWRA